MNTKKRTPAPLLPTTAEELLDREEDLALQRIAGTAQSLGEDLCTALDLRGSTRRHPFLATGLATVLGFVAGPLVPRAFKKSLIRAAFVAAPASMHARSMPRFVLTGLRRARAARAGIV
jgi:hypothetical protein